MNFNVGSTPKTTATTGFTLGGSTISQPAFQLGANTGLSFGVPDASKQAPLNFALPKTSAAVAPTSSLSINPLGNTTKTTAGFTLGATTGLSTGFSLGTAPAATSASTGFTLGSTSTAASSGFTLGGITTSTSLLSSGLGGTTASSTSTTTVPASITTTTVVTSSNVAATGITPSVNFVQLEEHINKWTIELEEQEKVFMNQVAQVNAWDRLLLSNGDKIVGLNAGVEKVKLEQQKLDHELDFILAQQKELEECLLPLEKQLPDLPVSDPERISTYQMAENLNSQLKQMSEDLKEVIEHINEKNKNQDTNDPIVQIGRILNAHMNSLQWVEQNTAVIQQQLDQVSKLTELHRRDNESTQNL